MTSTTTKRWAGLFIIAIMILSAFGFILSYTTTDTSSSTTTYGAYTFKTTPQGYTTTINDNTATFIYLPATVANIPITPEAKTLITTTYHTYVTYDPESPLNQYLATMQYLIEQEYPTQLNIIVSRGLTNTTRYALPHITCANATTTTPVLLLQQANTTSITTQNNCIIVSATSPDALARAHELIKYTRLGILP